MAGTKTGGFKARDTNIKLYGQDFYKKMGKLGGHASNRGGFYNNPELASRAGKIGGKIGSRIRWAKVKQNA